MPIYQRKPQCPIFQPGKLWPGTTCFAPLCDTVGSIIKDWAKQSTDDGALQGTQAQIQGMWQSGPYGAQLANFSASNYGLFTPKRQPIATGLYPFWIAAHIVSWPAGYIALEVPFCFGNSSSSTNYIYFQLFNGSFYYVLRGSSSLNLVVSDSRTNDASPHMLMGVSRAANDHLLFIDGQQIGSSATSFGTPPTLNRISIGARIRTTVDLPFSSAVIGTACGQGSFPNPVAFANDWLNGNFSPVRAMSKAIFMSASYKLPWFLLQRRAV